MTFRGANAWGPKVALLAAAGIASSAWFTAPAATQAEKPGRRTIWDGVYSSTQADRGQLLMGAKCGTCHAAKEWTGEIFLGTWAGRRVLDLYDTTRLTMPIEAPDSLPRDDYAAIIASILRMNRAAPGKEPLPSDREGLERIEITSKPEQR
jgi:hypothetical protein